MMVGCRSQDCREWPACQAMLEGAGGSGNFVEEVHSIVRLLGAMHM